MVLLDEVVRWDAAGILCRARSHLDPANPLRHAGRLASVCGLEYALQAAALHGALRAGGVAQPAGYVAALRTVALHADRLDEPNLGPLAVSAIMEAQEGFGMVYALEVHSAAGALLVCGRATIALPR